MAFAGYYIKINGNKFQNPMPAKEGYKLKEDIETDQDSKVNAAGTLVRNILPVKRHEITIDFPPMTIDKWRTYINLLDNDYITVEFYSYKRDAYRTAVFYMPTTEHNLFFKQGNRYIMQPLSVNLISYGDAT